MSWLFVAIGLVLLAAGGDWLVRGSVSVARALNVSPMLIGLTLVGFGTSSPELVTSLVAAIRGADAIAIGNVVGSNIANLLLILGIAALAAPLALSPAAFRRDGVVLALSTAVCIGAAVIGRIDRWTGAVLVSMALGYVFWAYRTERIRAPSYNAQPIAAETPRATAIRIARSLALAAIGIAATVLGARLLVDGAIATARQMGVSEALVGLTVVAVGTSLPELIACTIAAIRRHPEIALGNAIGSNIFNVLGVLGVVAIARPLSVPSEILHLDVWVLLAATALVLVFLRTGWTLRRWEGGALASVYLAYVAFIASSAMR